jgi:hypothetical protein
MRGGSAYGAMTCRSICPYGGSDGHAHGACNTPALKAAGYQDACTLRRAQTRIESSFLVWVRARSRARAVQVSNAPPPAGGRMLRLSVL